jgi:hypothetical protein
MRRFALTMAIVAATPLCLLVGCAPRPAIAPKPLTFQPEADAVRDWQIVAYQIAHDMMLRGLLHNPSDPGSPTASERQPYYIDVTIPPSQFQHEVRQSLQSAILYYGGTVAQSPLGATKIDLATDVVYWPSAYRRRDGAPSTEVAWEASIASGNQVIFDVRYPMYVSELDVFQYAGKPVGPPSVQLRYTP